MKFIILKASIVTKTFLGAATTAILARYTFLNSSHVHYIYVVVYILVGGETLYLLKIKTNVHKLVVVHPRFHVKSKYEQMNYASHIHHCKCRLLCLQHHMLSQRHVHSLGSSVKGILLYCA